MSQEFLSQDEVDALLKGVTGEEDDDPPATEVAQAKSFKGVRKYNLGFEERIVRGRLPTLELINERFGRLFRLGLFNYTHRSVGISSGPTRIQKFSEFIHNLVVPANLNIIGLHPLRGSGLLIFNPEMIFMVVDNMFGGNGKFPSRVEGRDFTPTESRIIQGILKVAFDEYTAAWAPVMKIDMEYVRSEMNAQFANIVTPSEPVVAVSYSVEISGQSTEMHLCLPYAMIEPIRDRLQIAMPSEHAASERRWNGRLNREMQGAEVELIALLASANLKVRDILELKTGDIIPINIEGNINVKVDDVAVATCRYGRRNGRYALKIEEFLLSRDPEELEPT